ncbi:hypothetical protein AYO41_02115 [Verrucomicrobia bacterium SCGC AG-212-E04]|nr:hypothetical protein AYO41_02115 [Verrucomicrobia bacterium SCGC AG-212-E04]
MENTCNTSEPSASEIEQAISVLERTSFREIQRLGWHFQRNDFYSPLNDCEFLAANPDLLGSSELLEIDMRIAHQEKVVAEVGRYVEELRDVPFVSDNPTTYCWQNNFWNNADALVQYGLIRSRKPRRVIEIGCGWSSLLLARALEANARESDTSMAEVTQIEPYPRKDVLAALPRHWNLLPVILQRASLEFFESLRAGDVLFYDGSHCSKVASDVNWFFFRILPRLAPGVLIHLHDILLPEDYPDEWIFKRGQTWNEQYLLQAFLMNNQRYQIEIANRYMFLNRLALLERHYAGVQPPWGASLWMTKV